MNEGRKKAVSLRLSVADLRKIKCIAERLTVRDTDVIRFAVKATLARLSLLADPLMRGRALLPLFIDPTKELARHFDLDAGKLDALINGGVDDVEDNVPLSDLHVIAMNGTLPLFPVSPAAGSSSGPGPTAHSRRGFETNALSAPQPKRRVGTLHPRNPIADSESAA
jgi:hypothetical protein